MIKSILAAAIVAASLQPLPAGAEEQTVKVGDPAVDGSFIEAYSNKWKLVGKGADGSVVEMGVWIDRAGLDEIAGRKVIRRRQLWVHDTGAEGYFNVVDAKTLAPIVSQYTNAAGIYYRVEYDVAGTIVRYQHSPQPGNEPGTPKLDSAAPMEQGELKTAAPYFDFNSGMFGLLIAGFPLKEGYSARFPVFKSSIRRPSPPGSTSRSRAGRRCRQAPARRWRPGAWWCTRRRRTKR